MQANTVPAAFWTVAYLLLPQNAAARKAVMQELQHSAIPRSSDSATEGATIWSDDTQPMPAAGPHASAGTRAAGSKSQGNGSGSCDAVREVCVRAALDRLPAES